MRYTPWMVAVSVAVLIPSMAQPQRAAASAQSGAAATFATMQTNVAAIAVPAEKARWQANVAMWEIRRSRTGALLKADLDKMRVSFDVMKKNVAAISEPAEKERWQANCDLWQIVLAQSAHATAAEKAQMQQAIKTIQTNVAKVVDPAEKGRWEANRDLWKAAIKTM
jgi:hypothetical protein